MAEKKAEWTAGRWVDEMGWQMVVVMEHLKADSKVDVMVAW